MKIVELTDLAVITQKLKDSGCGPHPVLAELRVDMFRGARCWGAIHYGQLIHVHTATFGKRKKNKWEPYCNWLSAFTHPAYRRQGTATTVAGHVRKLAVEFGCLRLKSKAGTVAGLRLHMSLGDEIWGLSLETLEAQIDTPLVAGDWRGVPPNAIAIARTPKKVLEAINQLKYDKEPV